MGVGVWGYIIIPQEGAKKEKVTGIIRTSGV
jgi:hypothetical protein